MATHGQDAFVDPGATRLPAWHPVSGNDPGSSFAPWSRSAQSATRLMATQPLKLTRARSEERRVGKALGTRLTCHWWPRDGNALAGRVRRCCREAAARLSHPLLERLQC